jgi:hypothetical protein
MNLGYAKKQNKIRRFTYIYPANDNQERLYSVGMLQDKIQLVVKLHPHGLGSRYLYYVDVFEGRILPQSVILFSCTGYKKLQ